MQVLCHCLMSFNEFEDKKKKAVEDASLVVVLLTNAISICIANNGQSSVEAVSTKHRK